MGGWGFPATSGTTPDAVATAARSAPGARHQALGGRVGGIGVGGDQSARPAGGGRDGGQGGEVEGAAPPHHGGIARTVPVGTITPRSSRASPGPPSASRWTRCPGSSNDAATRRRGHQVLGPRRRSRRGPAGPASRRWSGPSCWWRTPPGPRATGATPTAPATSPIGSPASHSTPSRSTIHTAASARAAAGPRSFRGRFGAVRLGAGTLVARPAPGGGGQLVRRLQRPGDQSRQGRQRSSATGRSLRRPGAGPPVPTTGGASEPAWTSGDGASGRALRSAMRSPVTLAARSQ